jgi:hypothetical protein
MTLKPFEPDGLRDIHEAERSLRCLTGSMGIRLGSSVRVQAPEFLESRRHSLPD